MKCPRCADCELDMDGHCDDCDWQQPFCTIKQSELDGLKERFQDPAKQGELDSYMKQLGEKYGWNASKVSINDKCEVRIQKLPS